MKLKSASLRMMRAKWGMEGKGKDSGMMKGIARVGRDPREERPLLSFAHESHRKAEQNER